LGDDLEYANDKKFEMKRQFFTILCSTVILGAGFGAFVGYYGTFNHFGFYRVSFDVQSDEISTTALYYDIGSGFNARDVKVLRIEQEGSPTRLTYCVAFKQSLRALRFDPCDTYCKMTIKSAKLIDRNGETTEIPLESIMPGDHIKWHAIDEEGYHFETDANAKDPNILIHKISLPPRSTGFRPISGAFRGAIKGVVAVLAAVFIFRFFFRGETLGEIFRFPGMGESKA
jgi:hypothetical protein